MVNKMARRNRVDGSAGVMEVVQGALSGPPEPPAGVKISEGVRPFWELVTTAKAKRAWTNSDLVLAADVARCMFRLESLAGQLESLIYSHGEQGEESREAEKLEKLADMLAKRIRMMNAHLQIHPEATQGKSHKQGKQNELHRKAASPEYGGDDLIPGLKQ